MFEVAHSVFLLY